MRPTVCFSVHLLICMANNLLYKEKRTQDYLLGSFYSYCGAAGRGRTGTIGEDRGILSPLRLPIPPQRHITLDIIPLYNVIVKP